MTQRPIVIRMTGGLANRMLQYGYYIFLKKKGYNAYVDYYKFIKLEHEKVLWEKIFSYASIAQAPSNLIFRYGGGCDLFSKLRRHYLKCMSNVYCCPNAFTLPSDEILEEYHYIIGVCHDARMVESISGEITNLFQFEAFIDEQNKALERKMRKCNSVAIHVRKGSDYMQNVKFQVCSLDYYKAAIDMIMNRVDHPNFFVFTDNAEWVNENFTFLDYELVNHNPTTGWGNHFDMQLMTYCKHNIIANSTYSWWGAFLNQNPSKIVIAPAKWFNADNVLNQDAAYCSNWVKI